MKDYTNKNPAYTDVFKVLETTDTDHADNFNVPLKQLMDNDLKLKDAISKCEKTALLTAGQTSAVFNFDPGSIIENNKIRIEASVPDVNYEGITVEEDSITVTFEAQKKDIYVKVVVSDAVV